ncbi:hypothetical protein DERF_005944 [Dermatophagoides farinae]|uniref:Uncharacterized protein n=1 Tax=Dermatophagoides farinae TaxID=6954 RepID=A0A922I6L9_DERFA|nr:hypothetical protein DERF_005944 [Dermatophagoides farinae]
MDKIDFDSNHQAIYSQKTYYETLLQIKSTFNLGPGNLFVKFIHEKIIIVESLNRMELKANE